MRFYYIAGASRSGSTVFAQVLSSVLDAYNIGEYFLSYCHEDIFIEDLPCSCGSNASTCKIWKADGDSMDKTMLALMSKRSRMRNSFFKATKFESDYFDRLMTNIKYKFGDESTVIETSKSPAFLRYLLNSDINLTVIHLTRNPYDCIGSWLTKKKYLEPKSFWGGFHDWFFMNYLTALYLKHNKFEYVRVKYEDFCEAPRKALSDILQEDVKNLAIQSDGKQNVFKRPLFNHALAGNPSKFDSTENIIIRNDGRQKKPCSYGAKGVLLKFVGIPFRY